MPDGRGLGNHQHCPENRVGRSAERDDPVIGQHDHAGLLAPPLHERFDLATDYDRQLEARVHVRHEHGLRPTADHLIREHSTLSEFRGTL